MLLINRKLCEGLARSEILINLPKQKLAIIKIHNFNKTFNNFVNMGKTFPKDIFPVQNRKSEYHYQIYHIRISLGTEFYLEILIF